MSDYCPSHPRYSAKREPNSLCGKCFELWHLRCPELKHDGERIEMEAEEAKALVRRG